MQRTLSTRWTTVATAAAATSRGRSGGARPRPGRRSMPPPPQAVEGSGGGCRSRPGAGRCRSPQAVLRTYARAAQLRGGFIAKVLFNVRVFALFSTERALLAANSGTAKLPGIQRGVARRGRSPVRLVSPTCVRSQLSPAAHAVTAPFLSRFSSRIQAPALLALTGQICEASPPHPAHRRFCRRWRSVP